MIGQVFLRRYRVLRLLDEGGMSRVYLGMQTDQPREVAVKMLLPQLAGQARVREHFRREIHITSRFHHNHAVAFYDADADGKDPVLVMEYLRGIDLTRLLERHRRLTPERAGRLLGQLCDVLHAAHAEGIVHRDLKPANVMVLHPDTPHEKVKLMDFGLAKLSGALYIAPEEVVSLSQPAAAGTPEYISPEQASGREADRRGDIYSLGVVLYEMLAGRRPFEGSVSELLKGHVAARPPQFGELGLAGQVPPGVEAVVTACLAKTPEERPQSAEEVARRYEAALGKKIYQPAAAKPASTVVRPSAVLRRGGDRLSAIINVPGAAERVGVVKDLTVTMPQSMAMVKLKGFIHDVGGEIVESVPGMIHVRLTAAGGAKKSGGLFGWLGGQDGPATAGRVLNMELHMETKDPAQPNQLTITLKLCAGARLLTTEERTRCEKIARDLQSYLIGR